MSSRKPSVATRVRGALVAAVSLLPIAAAAAPGFAQAPAPAAAPAASAAGGHVYTVDRGHSSVNFRIRHLVSRVDGRFEDFGGTVAYDPAKPEASSVDIVVQAASIDTGHQRRDADLRSENFFDVTKFPTLTFKSVSVKRAAGKNLDVTGDLTMHGVTKRLTIPVEVLGIMPFRGGLKGGFSTTFTVNRKDFAITWNRAVDQGGMLLGDDVEITVNLEVDWMPPKAGEGAPTAAPSPTPKPGR